MDPARQDSGALREPIGADFIIPALGCALTAYYLATTRDLVWEAKATGIVLGCVLIFLCALQFLRLALQIATQRGSIGLGELVADSRFNRQRLALILLVAVFIATIEVIGTTPGLFLLLAGSMLVMGVRSPRTIIAIAATTAGLVYLLLIHLLGGRLPQGPLEKLLGAALGGGA